MLNCGGHPPQKSLLLTTEHLPIRLILAPPPPVFIMLVMLIVSMLVSTLVPMVVTMAFMSLAIFMLVDRAGPPAFLFIDFNFIKRRTVYRRTLIRD